MYFCPVDGILFVIVIIAALITILNTLIFFCCAICISLRQLASLVSLSMTVFQYAPMQAIRI